MEEKKWLDSSRSELTTNIFTFSIAWHYKFTEYKPHRRKANFMHKMYFRVNKDPKAKRVLKDTKVIQDSQEGKVPRVSEVKLEERCV